MRPAAAPQRTTQGRRPRLSRLGLAEVAGSPRHPRPGARRREDDRHRLPAAGGAAEAGRCVRRRVLRCDHRHAGKVGDRPSRRGLPRGTGRGADRRGLGLEPRDAGCRGAGLRRRRGHLGADRSCRGERRLCLAPVLCERQAAARPGAADGTGARCGGQRPADRRCPWNPRGYCNNLVHRVAGQVV